MQWLLWGNRNAELQRITLRRVHGTRAALHLHIDWRAACLQGHRLDGRCTAPPPATAVIVIVNTTHTLRARWHAGAGAGRCVCRQGSTDVQREAVSVVVQVARRALVNLFRGSAHWFRPRHRLLPSQAALCTWRTWPRRTCCRRHCPAHNSYSRPIICHWKGSTLSHVRSFELSIAAPRHCVSTMLCKRSGKNVAWPSRIKIL